MRPTVKLIKHKVRSPLSCSTLKLAGLVGLLNWGISVLSRPFVESLDSALALRHKLCS